MLRPALLALLGLLSLPFALSFSFTLSSSPTVCQNLTLNWSGGTAPYEITLLPLGYVNPEIRTLVDTSTSANTWSQQLKYPAGSNFVIVLSDSTGYGTGGTSLVQTVGGGDSSCLPTSVPSMPFTFYMNPETPSQCQNLDFTWGSGASGQVVISAVIPGGNSFTIPVSGGSSAQWTADVQQGTEMAFIVGDSTGRGKGGSSDLMTVGGGSSSCLSGNYPSSTQGPAVGAVSTAGATSSSGSSSSSGGSSSGSGSSSSSSSSLPPGSGGGTVTGSPIATGRGGSGQQGSNSGSSTSSTSHTGAIVGGVIGGLAALALLGLLLFCCMRRRRRSTAAAESEKGRNGRADLLDPAPLAAGRLQHQTSPPGQGQRGRWYQQEPFIPPTTRPERVTSSSRVTPSTANATEGPISSYGNRTGTGTRSGTDPSHPSTSPIDTAAPALPPGAAAPRPRPDTSGDAALAAAAASHDPKKRAPEVARRPVNWVQHDDAGAVEGLAPPPAVEDGEPVTVDVPPSYDTLQRRSPPARA